MLEDQVAYLLQKYLGNYVMGLNKEALKISVWQGNVELTNMQLKPEALNALKLPVRVKAGFLGSVKLKVPWSKLGQEPVLVHLDRIFLLAEPATSVEGSSEDAVQEAKRNRVREMEMKLLERSNQLKSEVNKSWLGSLINTIIGNLKLSISNIHIRYEDLESNLGHPFAAGITLERLSAVTIDESGRETFVTGGSLDHIQKSVELNQLALYMDSDISPWDIDKPWEHMLPEEWVQVFRFGTKDGKPASHPVREHTYVLQPVTGNAKYLKSHEKKLSANGEPLQKAAVNLDDVTLCLSKNGYRDILKLADNFASFNERLKYAHYRPLVSVKSDPRSWWKYAYRVVSEQIKKASGKLSWEQVLRYTSLRKRYISLYASLLKSDMNLEVVDDNEEIKELDHGLDIELILQWRMLAHKFVEQSAEPHSNLKRQKSKKTWWSFGWKGQSVKDETESFHFSDEDWEQLNRIIGYKEDDDQQLVLINQRPDILETVLEIHVKRNASKLLDEAEACLAELSCEGLDCSVKLYPEAKVVNMKLESYQLSCPTGLIVESATNFDSLVGIFCYKPFDAKVDWSLVAKASPCYATYLKDSIDGIIKFFESNTAVSQTIALETAAAVQMTIDGVKRSAQQQVNRALKDHSRFSLDLDIAAPKITIPTEFQPDDKNTTKLLLDLGNLVIRSKDDHTRESAEEMDMYLQFDMVLSDISALLVDGDYTWNKTSVSSAVSVHTSGVNFFPVIDKCGVILKIQQIRLENPSFPSTRVAIRLPSLGFHFSPARYHRLMQVVKIFQEEDNGSSDILRPWDQADFEGWLSVLTRKGMGNREAVWQRRYVCLVGPFLYVLESPGSKSYKHCFSLRGKQIYQVPSELVGEVEYVLAVCDAARMNNKNVIEDVNALILHCDTDDSRRAWKSRLQGAIYHASGSAPIAGLSETSSDDSDTELSGSQHSIELSRLETLFLTGFLDELNMHFSYNYQGNKGFTKVLLGEESRLFQFRAVGGQVELLIKGSDMFIGTVLKSLEIEDLVCRSNVPFPCYLARSFIRSADAQPSFDDARNLSPENNYFPSSESDEMFYEASENLVDVVDNSTASPRNISEFLSSQNNTSFRTPSFRRIEGLLPADHPLMEREGVELIGTLESFVRAQIVIYDQNSPLYTNTDMQVSVTLATLSFFCRRPTVLAIMEFVNAINVDIESCESFSEDSSADDLKHRNSREHLVDDQQLTTDKDRVVKGFLGKGKSRIIFSLTLNMTHAEILLMTENETKLASLSQENLVTGVKVFPSSFSIKASLGNLRISDESLPSNHMYFWICDMRDPGGTSFVELLFSSFSADEEDYKGYEYSLSGQLSEVRIVYLNRFLQEIVSYFMGLIPINSKNMVKIKDQLTNSEEWFTTDEIEGSPALKLDLSLKKPIILMPRRTDSRDYLKLDVVHITVQNTFHWLCGNKNDMNAVHLEIMTVQVDDINLNVGIGSDLGESIIQDVKGVSVVIQRSLRDLLHQVPSIETTVKVEKLKAALSNKEYQVVTECAMSNISETPNTLPSLNSNFATSSVDVVEPVTRIQALDPTGDTWIVIKVSVIIELVELSLYSGLVRDISLATVQASGAWLLYKCNTLEEGFLLATLKDFSVIDDREGTKDEFRLAIGTSEKLNKGSYLTPNNEDQQMAQTESKDSDAKPFPTMLILDAKFGKSSTSVSACIQRPQLLVALDFLLAVVEFFVPTVSNLLLDEENKSLHVMDAIILDQPTYRQPAAEISLSPLRPLIIDDERFDHFIYDGNGGIIHLTDREGANLSAPGIEPIIHVESGKKLKFKNVTIKNGQYLDSCISLGTNSSYSASEDDCVFLEGSDESQPSDSGESAKDMQQQKDKSADVIIDFQAVSPELTFYSTSKEIGESPVLSNRLLHAQLDAVGRLVLKDDTVEVTAKALGLTMESNGVRILEPFDTSIKYSNASGKANISLSVSDIFMNFSFSILRLFLVVEEEIMGFLRTKSKELTVVCSEFDRVGMIRSPDSDQVYTFWRPLAPSGFAVLGDYLTPTDKPPSKGVLAINTQFIRVKRPKTFKLIWSSVAGGGFPDQAKAGSDSAPNGLQSGDSYCSVWFPEAPDGYVALGCVVSPGKEQPLASCTFCVLASFVSHCSLRDCVTISCTNIYASTMAFWRVSNSLGTFLPSDPATLSLLAVPYELRPVKFGFSSLKASGFSNAKATAPGHAEGLQPDISAATNSSRFYEAVASFRLIWWNRGSNTRKRLSIWRPEVPEGIVYFGDIAVNGYEPPSTCVVLRETGNEELFRAPVDFQLVGQIKKQRGMESLSFWQPQAPPGFVSLGCIACKGSPKQDSFCSLRCIRSDMVSGDQFLEESVWDTTDTKVAADQFSIWTVGNELGTFVVRSGFRKPPRRFALKLADQNLRTGSDVTVIDAKIRTFSVALFDDYGGLMVPLFNLSMSGIGFSLHGQTDYLNSAVSFSLAARSYNEKHESWEPLIEPVDGFLRYQHDPSTPSAASQLRFTSTRDLNLNVSVSNANMVFQAYASWNNFSHIHEYPRRQEISSPFHDARSAAVVHQKRSYYLMPQNKLGQDIFLRATEMRGISSVVRMPSGDVKPIKVPVSQNMLDAHSKAEFCQKFRAMVTVIIVDAEFPRVEDLVSHEYAVSTSLSLNQSLGSESRLDQQSAHTCGRFPKGHISSQKTELVNWDEIFFFKIDSAEQYKIEFILTDMGKGDAIGFFSAPLHQIAKDIHDGSGHDYVNSLMWIDLFPAEPVNTSQYKNASGRLRCAVLVSSRYTVGQTDDSSGGRKSGFIQISPSIGGPWTTVRLNYAAPAACWRLGNDVVASEVSIKEGNRYLTIRSLVSVRNSTEFVLDLSLAPKASHRKIKPPVDARIDEGSKVDFNNIQTDEVFETEKYEPAVGWINWSAQKHTNLHESGGIHQGIQLPSGWEWVDDWHLDTSSVHAADGWVYAPNIEGLNWPESSDSLKFVNHARQRRWIRQRKHASEDTKEEILVGQLKPGEVMPLPLSGLTQPGLYILQLRPSGVDGHDGYSWSSVVKCDHSHDSNKPGNNAEICVSALTESEELLYCSPTSGTSSGSSFGKIWFCVSIQATEIAKDVNSNPIQDWNLVIKSPLSVANYLPFKAEYSIFEKRESGHFVVCSRGILFTEKAVKLYSANIRNPLFLSLVPQWGWLPVHEAVLISHPLEAPSKTMSLRSSVTGRIVQLILEQNYNTEKVVLAKSIRIYAPYWFSVARCPPLKYRLQELQGRKHTKRIGISVQSKRTSELNFEEITDEEMHNGFTIASALNFKLLGLSVSIAGSDNERYGPVKELSPLGDMDGSMDVDAYDGDGRCLRLSVSAKPCSYQSVPTKVLTVRPYMTFTNRTGQDILIKLNSGDEPKVLHTHDVRVSFIHSDDGAYKLQVRLVDTEWSFPVQIVKEDTIFLVLRRANGTKRFLRAEIRGYEEGSRFIVVFRLGSADGPIRIENRTMGRTISIRQSGFSENAWTSLQPRSTTNFSWEDPYGQKFMDVKVDDDSDVGVWKLDFERVEMCSMWKEVLGMQFQVIEIGDIQVARFIDERRALTSHEGNRCLVHAEKSLSSVTSFEIIIELGVVGISVVDHRPKELSYVYLERVFVSYSTGYDGGNTSRFKLILGDLQIDNQLPLTLMPVLLAPEESSDLQHPVFKMTITVRSDNIDGIQVFPYVYIRVTDKCWRLNIHEPIIWALVEFYNNLQLDRIPKSSSVTQVDPEIRFDFIDVSELRLKMSLETAPAQRPDGVLGVWSPILSAIGNAFKIQVHLRRVMHRDRFMRQSSIFPAIGNRVWRDLIHNPLHLIFSVDVLGMTSSTLASLSKGFAELSTDGQFLELRSKQVSSRKVTGVGDGIIQGTEALAQSVAFGVSGVVRKPVESARQNGLLGLAQGLGRAFVGFFMQPVSGALDFFSLTVDGIGASCSRCLEVLSNTNVSQRIRNPRAIRADGVLTEYSEKDAVGQMVLHLAEASRRFGCTEIFKEPSKFALSDYYEEHFVVPHQRIVLVTNKRVMLLQCSSLDKMDKKPSKIMWDVPWEELLSLELAKVGLQFPSHLILHLKNFRRSENFVRVIKCHVEEVDGREPQVIKICSVVCRMWKSYLSNMRSILLKVPASQRFVSFSSADSTEPSSLSKTIIKSRGLSSSRSVSSHGGKFVKHSVNFLKVWSSEQKLKIRCALCKKQASQDDGICSIWRPICPDGYVSIGDIAHVGSHPPNVAAVYQNDEKLFALPVGFDLVWRNCLDDYRSPVSIWYPRPPEGFVSIGCVAVASFTEPEAGTIYCVADSIAEETVFEEHKIWSAPDSYPWGCHMYQVRSDALHFVALRRSKEEMQWKPMRVLDDREPRLRPSQN